MDEIDRRILNRIQEDFPLESRPWDVLGNELGLAGAEVLARVKALFQAGLIRRLGASWNSRALGFYSTLCAARVPRDKLDLFVEKVNSYPGVTHNYERTHQYNVWFTFIAESEERVRECLEEIRQSTGVSEVRELPARRSFKVRVKMEV